MSRVRRVPKGAAVTRRAYRGTAGVLIAAAWLLATPVAGERVLVCGWDSNSLAEYDPVSGEVVELIPSGAGGLRQPHSVVAGVDGRLYVTSVGSHQVLRFERDGTFVDAFVSARSGGLQSPTDALFHPNGGLLVASFGTHEVLHYDGETGAFLGAFVSAASGGLQGPEQLVIAPDGTLLVAAGGNSAVLRFDGETGASLGTWIAPGSGGLTDPHALVFGPNGDLYVPAFDGNDVLRYDGSTGEFVSVFIASGAAGLNRPHGGFFDADQDLHLASFGTSEVLRFDGESGVFLDAQVGVDDPIQSPIDVYAMNDDVTCEAVRKFKVKCRASGKMTVRPKTSLPGGSSLVIEMAGVTRVLRVKNNGNAKLVRRGLGGRQSAGLPGCADRSRTRTCGQP